MATSDEFPSRKELLAAAAAGNDQAIEELVARYKGLVYRNILYHLTVKGCNARYDHSQDLIGPALFAILWNLTQLEDSEKFKSWVNSIISNLVSQHVSGPKGCISRQNHTEQLRPTQDAAIESVEKQIEAGVWVDEMVDRAYKQSFMFGEILRLHLVEGYTLEEVSKLLGQPYGKVHSFYYRNLKAFRKSFTEGSEDDDNGDDGDDSGSQYVH